MENQPASILYLTNNIEDKKNLINVLNEFGTSYYLICLPKGDEAFEYMNVNGVPSLIVYDTLLSGMNGFDFLKELYRKNIYKGKRVPIIFLEGTETNLIDKEITSNDAPENINYNFQSLIKQILNYCKFPYRELA